MSVRLNILKFSFRQAMVLTIVGAFLGIIYAYGGLFVDSMVTLGILSPEKWETPGLSMGTIYAFGALIGMPFILGSFGLASGIVEAILFNFFSSLISRKKER